MDKLRALEYFVAAAEARSLSGAARQLNVSVPAIAKLINGLERRLGVRLFERTAQGLALTANGESYLETCQPLLAELDAADELVSASTSRPSGTVAVGAQHVLAYHCLIPALARFHALYPDIRVDLHDFNRPTEEQMRGVDVFLVLGWPRVGDLVHRQIGSARFVVCATPEYWAMHGKPQRPQDLARHNCLLTRSVDGIVMDLWSFRRGEQAESVTVTGWLVTSNPHRDGAMTSCSKAGRSCAGSIWRTASGCDPARWCRCLPTGKPRRRRRSICFIAPAAGVSRACGCSSTSSPRSFATWIGNATGGSCRAGDRSGCGSTRGSRQR